MNDVVDNELIVCCTFDIIIDYSVVAYATDINHKFASFDVIEWSIRVSGGSHKGVHKLVTEYSNQLIV